MKTDILDDAFNLICMKNNNNKKKKKTEGIVCRLAAFVSKTAVNMYKNITFLFSDSYLGPYRTPKSVLNSTLYCST
jgi:hypothetical protein